MDDVSWPPRGFGRIAPLVGMVNLLSRLNNLDPFFSKSATVVLVESLEATVVECLDGFAVADSKTSHVCSRGVERRTSKVARRRAAALNLSARGQMGRVVAIAEVRRT